MKLHYLLLLIALISLSNTSYSQSGKAIPDLGSSNFRNTFNVFYGSKILQEGSLGQQLNTFDNYKFGNTISYIGIGGTEGLIMNRKHNLVGNISYSQVIPQSILVNGTIDGNLTGFNISLTIVGTDLFFKNKMIDLIVDGGFNTGRLRIYGDDLIKQKNPYFSPYVGISPRLAFKKFSVNIRCNYDYDISSKHWRKMTYSKTPKVPIEDTSLGGLSMFAGIGFTVE